MLVVNNYKPSKRLLAIEPKWNEYGEAYAKVYEELRTITVKKSAVAVLEEVLHFNGQSLRGAKEGTRALLGSGYYTPITINEVHGLYMFCTGPFGKADTAYIMLGAVLDLKARRDGGTTVKLINGETFDVKTMNPKVLQKREDEVVKLKHKREQHTSLMARDFQYCAEFDEKYDSELEEK